MQTMEILPDLNQSDRDNMKVRDAVTQPPYSLEIFMHSLKNLYDYYFFVNP
ncbi:MAG: hypothetical protein ACP5JM_04030 [Thermoplasmata archaeon]